MYLLQGGHHKKHFLLWGFFSPLLIVKWLFFWQPKSYHAEASPLTIVNFLWKSNFLFQHLSHRHFTPSQTGSPLFFDYYCERYINVSIFKQTYWVYLSCLGIYHFRADHIVLDSPLRGSCLRKTNSASLSSFQFLSIGWLVVGPWKMSPFLVSISMGIIIVQVLLRQSNCWGFMSEVSLSYLGDTISQ